MGSPTTKNEVRPVGSTTASARVGAGGTDEAPTTFSLEATRPDPCP